MTQRLFRVILLLLAVVLTTTASIASAKTTVAGIFTDNLVLQRDMAVPVWGWAEAGEQVTVLFAGQEKSAAAGADGKWSVALDALPVSAEPRDMTIRGAETITLKNVVVGEVWFCAGQSNMGLSLAEVFNAKEEVAQANYPLLRLMGVPATPTALPMKDIRGGKWKVCTPETAAGFAGTAYFFGRAMQDKLKIPVGIIETDVGATGIEGWVPLAAYREAKEPALQQIYQDTAAWNPAGEIGKAAHAQAFKDIHAWLPVAKAALAEGKPVPPQPLVPAPPRHVAGPTIIFNGTIHPITPYAIRGVVWYQGESNPGEGAIYEHKLRALVNGWRGAWGRDDLPIYIVQLTNEGKPVEEPAEEETFRYVPVRQAQRRAATMPNTGLVVAIDLGEEASGHPRNKKDVGERAALWAFTHQYKMPVPFTGPLYKDHRVDGNHVIIAFDHVGGGLMVGDKLGMEPVRELPGEPLRHFSLKGADGKWHWAEAKIDGNQVIVWSDRVPAPIAVRYADSMNPKGGKLYNREGLPASPFRTDEW